MKKGLHAVQWKKAKQLIVKMILKVAMYVLRILRTIKNNLKRIRSFVFTSKERAWIIGIIGTVVLFNIVVVTIWRARTYNYDYSKGILTLNTDKASYKLGESVFLRITHIDSEGKPKCGEELDLVLDLPWQWKNDELSIKDGTIVETGQCGDNSYSLESDYIARYVPLYEGKYDLKLINANNGKHVRSSFVVSKEDPSIMLERFGPTRITDTTTRYPMTIKVTSKNGFQGKLVDYVPIDMNIIWKGTSEVTKEGNRQLVMWDIQLQAGESKEFVYEFQLDKEEKAFYTFGKSELLGTMGVHKEQAQWQVSKGE